MSFKYGVLCLFLLVVILFLAVKSYEALTQPLELMLDKGSAKRSEAKAEGLPVKAVVKESPSITSYISIAEKNIFNPERKDFPVMVVGSAIPAKPLARPQVVLYGVTLAGEYQAASLVQVGRPLQKGERETVTIKLGERIGEYKLTKVLSDRVILETEGDSFEIFLYDPKMPKKRMAVRTEISPTGVISTQPTPPTPSPAVPTPPISPTTPREVARPVPPREPVQERVAVPTPPSPTPPSLPTPEVRRGRRVIFPPTQVPTPATGEMDEN
jgi:hypothetical protein